MIRIVTELALFAAPFVIYALYLVVTRADVLHPDSWSLRIMTGLVVAALLLVAGSFVWLTHFSGSPPGSAYVPAHMENGAFVPGETK
jgi:heme/copper-type cytochrome/quinol oxidase subunit 3